MAALFATPLPAHVAENAKRRYLLSVPFSVGFFQPLFLPIGGMAV
jgi:hypothetical protein